MDRREAEIILTHFRRYERYFAFRRNNYLDAVFGAGDHWDFAKPKCNTDFPKGRQWYVPIGKFYLKDPSGVGNCKSFYADKKEAWRAIKRIRASLGKRARINDPQLMLEDFVEFCEWKWNKSRQILLTLKDIRKETVKKEIAKKPSGADHILYDYAEKSRKVSLTEFNKDGIPWDRIKPEWNSSRGRHERKECWYVHNPVAAYDDRYLQVKGGWGSEVIGVGYFESKKAAWKAIKKEKSK